MSLKCSLQLVVFDCANSGNMTLSLGRGDSNFDDFDDGDWDHGSIGHSSCRKSMIGRRSVVDENVDATDLQGQEESSCTEPQVHRDVHSSSSRNPRVSPSPVIGHVLPLCLVVFPAVTVASVAVVSDFPFPLFSMFTESRVNP